eukprot:TRINITY_DN7386_c0_g5_i1.p1 TRINITY_DN7386_c0_g5~~TRINITY_DN7386_c0_g5_i1.p1  ORF type:complete len:1921 (+),score=803.83 TRINITY_DN7386_c0_g5_i1:104-5866(+)
MTDSVDKIAVLIRVRPPPDKRAADPSGLKITSDSVVVDSGGRGSKSYVGNRVFGFDAVQQDVYDGVMGPVLPRFLDGFNCTILAYGQTGSGKTHTMMGGKGPDEAGVIRRLLRDLFRHKRGLRGRVTFELSFIEIYQGGAYDLLSSTFRQKLELSYSQLPHGEVRMEIPDEEAGLKIIEKAHRLRHVAATKMNHASSRSHAICTVYFSHVVVDDGGEEVVGKEVSGKLNLVDLAGSEKLGKSGAEGNTQREAIAINGGLFALGGVIEKLSELEAGQEPQPHIFRNDLLTMVLRDSFGGNSLTSFIATISPDPSDRSESLNTLEYACRAGKIVNCARKNVKLDTEELNKQLRDIAALKRRVALQDNQTGKLHEELRKLRSVQVEFDEFKVDAAAREDDLRVQLASRGSSGGGGAGGSGTEAAELQRQLRKSKDQLKAARDDLKQQKEEVKALKEAKGQVDEALAKAVKRSDDLKSVEQRADALKKAEGAALKRAKALEADLRKANQELGELRVSPRQRGGCADCLKLQADCLRLQTDLDAKQKEADKRLRAKEKELARKQEGDEEAARKLRELEDKFTAATKERDRLQRDQRKAKGEVAEADDREKELRKRAADLERDLERTKDALARAERDAKRKAELDRELERAKEGISRGDKEKGRLERDLEKAKDALSRSEKDLASKSHVLKTSQSKWVEQDVQLQRAARERDQVVAAARGVLGSQLQAVQSMQDSCRRGILDAASSARELLQRVEQATRAAADRYTLSGELRKTQAALKKASADRDQLEARVADREAVVARLQAAVRDTGADMEKTARELRDREDRGRKEQAETAEQVRRMHEERGTLQRDSDVLRSTVQRLEQELELATRRGAEAASARQELDSARKRIADLEADGEKARQQLRDEREEAAAELRRCREAASRDREEAGAQLRESVKASQAELSETRQQQESERRKLQQMLDDAQQQAAAARSGGDKAVQDLQQWRHDSQVKEAEAEKWKLKASRMESTAEAQQADKEMAVARLKAATEELSRLQQQHDSELAAARARLQQQTAGAAKVGRQLETAEAELRSLRAQMSAVLRWHSDEERRCRDGILGSEEASRAALRRSADEKSQLIGDIADGSSAAADLRRRMAAAEDAEQQWRSEAEEARDRAAGLAAEVEAAGAELAELRQAASEQRAEAVDRDALAAELRELRESAAEQALQAEKWELERRCLQDSLSAALQQTEGAAIAELEAANLKAENAAMQKDVRRMRQEAAEVQRKAEIDRDMHAELLRSLEQGSRALSRENQELKGRTGTHGPEMDALQRRLHVVEEELRDERMRADEAAREDAATRQTLRAAEDQASLLKEKLDKAVRGKAELGVQLKAMEEERDGLLEDVKCARNSARSAQSSASATETLLRDRVGRDIDRVQAECDSKLREAELARGALERQNSSLRVRVRDLEADMGGRVEQLRTSLSRALQSAKADAMLRRMWQQWQSHWYARATLRASGVRCGLVARDAMASRLRLSQLHRFFSLLKRWAEARRRSRAARRLTARAQLRTATMKRKLLASARKRYSLEFVNREAFRRLCTAQAQIDSLSRRVSAMQNEQRETLASLRQAEEDKSLLMEQQRDRKRLLEFSFTMVQCGLTSTLRDKAMWIIDSNRTEFNATRDKMLTLLTQHQHRDERVLRDQIALRNKVLEGHVDRLERTVGGHMRAVGPVTELVNHSVRLCARLDGTAHDGATVRRVRGAVQKLVDLRPTLASDVDELRVHCTPAGARDAWDLRTPAPGQLITRTPPPDFALSDPGSSRRSFRVFGPSPRRVARHDDATEGLDERHTATVTDEATSPECQDRGASTDDSYDADGDVFEKCAWCGRTDGLLRPCSACHTVAYCDARCQRQHWVEHSGLCMWPDPGSQMEIVKKSPERTGSWLARFNFLR